MSKSAFDVDSIKSMTMTDDGIQFELDESDEEEKESGEEEEEFTLAEEGDEQEEEEEELVEDKSSRSKSKSGTDIEERFNRIEGLIDKMATAIVSGKSAAKVAEEEEEDLDDLDDPKKLLSTIEKRVTKLIDNRLAPHQDAMQAATVRSQFDSAAGRYGQAFIDAAPLVARLMLASKGALSVEEAYSSLKDNGLVSSNGGRKTKQQIVKEKKAKTVDADDEEVVTSGNRVPLRKKGRSVKESAMEALKRLSRGEL